MRHKRDSNLTPRCYMCEERATSREHVPPICLFPEAKDLPVGFDFRKNLISVPSCPEHNSVKSKDDEYLMFVVASALQGNQHKQRHFETKVMRAYRRNPRAYSRFFENLTPVVLADETGRVVETGTFEVDVSRFTRCMQHIAAGILYHHSGVKPKRPFRVVTDAFAELRGSNAKEVNDLFQFGTRAIAEAFSTVPLHGQNLPIFQYRVHTSEVGAHAVLMTFYEGIRVAAVVNDA